MAAYDVLLENGDQVLLESGDILNLEEDVAGAVSGTMAGAATSSGTIVGTKTVHGTMAGGATAAGTIAGTRVVLGTMVGSAVSSGTIAAATITPSRSASAIRWTRKRGSMATTTTVVKIASGQTTSNEIDLRNGRLLAIHMPAATDGATISFTARPGLTDNPGSALNDSHQQVVNDAGTVVSITATDAKYISTVGAIRDALDGVAYLKLVSASSESADRSYVLVIENGRG